MNPNLSKLIWGAISGAAMALIDILVKKGDAKTSRSK